MPTKKPVKKKPSIKAVLTTALACLGAIAGILKKSDDISGWLRREFPKNPYDVSVTFPHVVPANLKYYYDSEGLGSQQSLYWFRAKVQNRTRESLYLELSFTLLPSDCRFVVLESKDPVRYSLAPGETKLESISPPLEFMKHDVESDCYLRINWSTENGKKEEAYKRAGIAEIRLLPLHTIKWDLANPENKAVSREFLLGSLTAWSKSREGKVLQRAASLRHLAGGSTDEHRLELCYDDLFHGQSAIAVTSTDRTFPFVREQTITVPGQVLVQKEAEPLEAALLMASIVRASSPSRRLHLSLFIVPTEQQTNDPSVLLAWPSGTTWNAIDLRHAGRLPYRINQKQSTEVLAQAFSKEPRLERELADSGIVAGNGPSSCTAVSFDKAAEQFGIRDLD